MGKKPVCKQTGYVRCRLALSLRSAQQKSQTSYKLVVYSANIELTDSSILTRLMACASISDKLTTRIFSH